MLVCVGVDPCKYVQHFKHIHNLHGVEPPLNGLALILEIYISLEQQYHHTISNIESYTLVLYILLWPDLDCVLGNVS